MIQRRLRARVFDGLVIALVLSSLAFAVRSFAPVGPVPAEAQARLGGTVPAFETLAALGTPLHHGSSQDTLVLFTDFQCPYCKSLAVALDTVLERLGRRSPTLKILHLPITARHPLAYRSAAAAECAATQGQFAAAHDALFAAREALMSADTALVAQVLTQVGVRVTPACPLSHSIAARLATHAQVARELGIRGTPALILNGRWVEGQPTASGLLRLLGGS
jgi:protein-disulfide isomerase